MDLAISGTENLFRVESCGDDLSELHDEAVPEEVRLWLAETFAKQDKVIMQHLTDYKSKTI